MNEIKIGALGVVVQLLGMSTIALAAMAGAPNLIGTWDTSINGQTVTMTLNPDGTGALMEQSLRYTVRENRLETILEGEPFTFTFSLDGDRLILTGEEMGPPMTFSRRSSAETGAPGTYTPQNEESIDAGIVGKWKDPNGSIIELRKDGVGSNAQGEFHYVTNNGYLFVTESQLLLQYLLDGPRLIVTGAAGSLTFERAPADAKVAAASTGPSAAPQEIVVNGVRLTPDQIRRFEKQYQIRMLHGLYWYDRNCGAWGQDQGPTLGFLPPHLDLGGALRPDASGKAPTGVFINGRQIHPVDLAALQQITPVVPGRFWVDASGNCGYEGNPVPIANLVQLSRAAQSKGGSYISRSDITGIGTGGDGKTSYVMGKDWSVIVGE